MAITLEAKRWARSDTSIPPAQPLVPECDSNSTKARIVHREDLNGHSTDLCLSDQVCTVPFKMVTPLVPPRVKELDDSPSFWVPSGDVGTLALVAVQAGKSEILEAGFSAMLPSYNVVDVE
jgi:hypothetical protein